MAARPSSLVSSGKAWGGSRKGVGRCGGQTDPSPPAALAAMGPGLLFPLLLLRALGAPGSELDAGGRHVCKASRARLPPRLTPLCPTAPLLSSSAAQAGGRKIKNAPSPSARGWTPAGKTKYV